MDNKVSSFNSVKNNHNIFTTLGLKAGSPRNAKMFDFIKWISLNFFPKTSGRKASSLSSFHTRYTLHT
jgi:hypothetical protein